AKNPHVWMSPLIAKEMVERIYTEVITIDAQNANNYQINKNSYITELDALHQRILANRSIFQSRKVVVHHPSFKYLFDLLGIDRIAAIEEHEGGEPSAEHIAEIVDTMKEQDVKLIINQPQLSADQVNQIARDTGAKIADLTPLLGVEDQNGDPILDYISMIEYNLWALVHPHNPPLESSSPIIWFGLGITVISIAVAIITIILRMRPRSIE
ncbi:MAG: metal ABC transporter substrate-binding protein, partial [Candidatus Hodarchaeota archaeon]